MAGVTSPKGLLPLGGRAGAAPCGAALPASGDGCVDPRGRSFSLGLASPPPLHPSPFSPP